MSGSAKVPKSPDFPQTRWSLVLAVQGKDEALSGEALASLCQAYWYPIYAHARRSCANAADAEDLTQAFFENLLDRDIFERVKPEGGRLRSYLLKAMNHFMAGDFRKRTALKRGGGRQIVSIDQEVAEGRFLAEPRDTEDPEVLYERRWARSLLDQVFELLRKESEERDRVDEFEVIHPLLVPGGEDLTHQEIGNRLGISEGAARSRLFRMRQRYGDLLREVISDTVVTPDDVADEISHLMRVFRSTTAA